MKFWKQSLLFIFFLGILSCSDDSVNARREAAPDKPALSERQGQTEKSSFEMSRPDKAQEEMLSGKAGEGPAKAGEGKINIARPTEEEARQADRIISFSNQVRNILHSGIYATADILRHNVQYYRKNWVLPKQIRLPSKYSRDGRLNVQRGIFTEEEEKQLTQSLDGMDKALNEILSYYRQLEKYISDSTIIDDGKKGLELSEKLLKSHTLYAKARKNWLSLVEAKAEAAEEKLLYEHPLRRQILAVKNIFAQMGKIEELAASPAYNKDEMKALRQNFSAIIEEAGRPPFQASPELERLFRSYLKDAHSYCKILDRGMQEGFHNVQKRELMAAKIKCQNAYNKFVDAANK